MSDTQKREEFIKRNKAKIVPLQTAYENRI